MPKYVKFLSGLTFLVFLYALMTPTITTAQTVSFQEAKVSLAFDDGFLTTFTNALPILSGRNIPATEFVTTSFIDKGITDDGLATMSWSQLSLLQNQYGWEIGSHTLTHAELPMVSVTQIKTELSQSKSILESKGFQITSLASPFGAYNNNTLIEALKLYNLHRGFWDRDDLNSYPADRSVIMVKSVETGVSFTAVKAWIDQAISQKKWLVLVFHEVRPTLNPNYEYTITTDELIQIADYIKQTGIKTVRMDHTLQKPGVNLVVNPTFNTALSNGWSTDIPTQIQPDGGSNGSYPSPLNSVKLTGGATMAKLFSPGISVSPNSYLLQIFINSTGLTSGQINFSVDEYGSNGNLLANKPLGTIGTNAIKYFSAFYQPTSITVQSIKLQTSISANAKGSAYVDNYELYNLNGTQPSSSPSPTTTPNPSLTPSPSPTASPTPKPSITPSPTPKPSPSPIPSPKVSPSPTPTPIAGNLVLNGSFEQLFSNWSKDSTSFSIDTTAKGDAGSNSVRLLKNSSEAHLTSDKITVVPGTTYTWKQYLKATQTSGEFGFYIDEFDVTGKWISWQWKGAITSLFTGIKQYSYKPSSTKVKTITINYYADPNSAFDLYLDSISLTK